jgi:succinyl-diaminopimelate desuccinylase
LKTLRLVEELLARASVTPEDKGCLDIIASRLAPLGFECQRVDSGPDTFRVSNLWALRKSGHAKAKLLVFAGHTDVVPTGPLEQWQSQPFVPTHRDGKLYARGASDMKTSIAAMVVACEEFVAAQKQAPQAPLDIAFLLTSDEEGPSVDGTVVVCEWLKKQNITPDYCIVGEPTSVQNLGDMIKNGRRGTLSGKLMVKGIQGHIAYPHLAKNPIHSLAPALAELVATEWDKGNAFFPPTTWQVSNIHGGTGAGNIIPGTVEVMFNFRFSTESTAEGLKARVAEILARKGLQSGTDYDLHWTLGGQPFITPPGELVAAITKAIQTETTLKPELSTTGGTSDGRFMAQICKQVIEFGPTNASIHKINEFVQVSEIEPLKNIYRRTLEGLALS